MRVADQLRDTGRVTRGRIGVGIAEVTKDVAEALSLQRASGALVRSVEAGSPAERGGVEVGDIITRFDGRPIERSSDLPRLVGGTRPGTQVSVQVWRKGSTRDLNLTVAELEPDRSARASGRGTPGENQERGAANVLGVTVSDISEDRKQQLRIRQGVLVEAADGAGARAGIRAGDVILALNNQDIGSAKQFNEIVAKLERSRTHVLLIRRGDSAQYVPVRPAAR
jgi:serine protease Do